MSRTTLKQLLGAVERLNLETNSPTEYFETFPDGSDSFTKDGRRTIAVGHYHIDQCYGGYQLVQTTNNSGGIRTVQPCRGTKTDCWNAVHTVLNVLRK